MENMLRDDTKHRAQVSFITRKHLSLKCSSMNQTVCHSSNSPKCVIYPFAADRQTVVQQHHSSGNDKLKHWQESYKISMLEVHHLIVYPTDHMIPTAWNRGHFIIQDSSDYHPTWYVGHVSSPWTGAPNWACVATFTTVKTAPTVG